MNIIDKKYEHFITTKLHTQKNSPFYYYKNFMPKKTPNIVHAFCSIKK